MPRITDLNMTTTEVLMALAENNPGAVTVLTQFLEQCPEVCTSKVEPMILILYLDELEIYGPQIWYLYKDICGENISKFIGLVRAYQLGACTQDEIYAFLDTKPYEVQEQGIPEKLQQILTDANEMLAAINSPPINIQENQAKQ